MIFSRASVARASDSLASATCRLAALSSTARWAMNFCFHQFLVALVVGAGDGEFGLGLLDLRLRQLVVQLHQQLAAAHAVSASRKLICVTRPDTSGRSITLWRERRLPTAWASSDSLAISTLAASTEIRFSRAAPLPAAGDEASAALPWRLGFLQPPGGADATAMPATATAI
jgi:hypothetical protein